jgi:hypothetical protein
METFYPKRDQYGGAKKWGERKKEDGGGNAAPVGLVCCYVFGLWTFFALTDFECDLLALFESYTVIPVAVNLSPVYKNVFAAVILFDKTKTFFAVEPFNGSC